MSPAPLGERVAGSLRLRWLDARDRVSGRADRLVPPRRMDFVGHSDFVDTGEEFLGHFVALGGLQPHHAVLDIGCGIGRMARPLVAYLSPEGRYEGFDVNAEGIAWCTRRYARHPNARFQVADLFNARYNPDGTQDAASFRFPYEDETFDLAVATSVFTHLLPAAAERYVAEAVRVLRPGGRLLATFFLLDEGSRALLAAGRSGLPFADAHEDVALVDDAMPEEAVAYAATWLAATLARHGLSAPQVHPGSWCGREDHTSFQDIVIAERERTHTPA
jgi:SAM-dependent methyltransferase